MEHLIPIQLRYQLPHSRPRASIAHTMAIGSHISPLFFEESWVYLRKIGRAGYSTNVNNVRTIPLSIIENDMEQWKAIFDEQKPVVIKNYANSWPALSHPRRKWELPRLLKRLEVTDSVVTVEVRNR